MQILKLITQDNKTFLINELQVSSIQQGDRLDKDKHFAIIRMANGDEFIVKDPEFGAWENDLFVHQK